MPMFPTAHRARLGTILTLGAAVATILAASLLHPRAKARSIDDRADDGMKLTARFTTTKLLRSPQRSDIAVTITAPGRTARPPLSLAIVLDRSASMSGAPFANAKAAAARLIDKLDSQDAFSIIGYAGEDATVAPMAIASRAAKSSALAALAQLSADPQGSTCIACGLTRGAGELAHSPIAEGVSRIVLISDGQATESPTHELSDLATLKDDLAQLAADTAARGISISAIGVGLEFDELTMIRIAELGRGNYYFVESTRHLDAMFTSELEGLAATVAANARLIITPGPGTLIEDVIGYPFTRAAAPSGSAAARGDIQVIVPIADLRAGETRKVVLQAVVAPDHTGAIEAAHVELQWRRISDGANRSATTAARSEVTEDPSEVSASVDGNALEAVEQALSARAFEDASVAYDRYGAAAAQQVIQVRSDAVRANRHLSNEAVRRIDAAHQEAIRSFAAAPSGGDEGTRAKKVSRVRAYQLAR